MIRYRSVNEAADYILNVLQEFIGVNTLFIATNDGVNNTILRAINREEQLVREGQTIPLLQTYCSLVFQGASSAVIIPDTSLHPVASKMEITETIGPCSFIGVPIATSKNESYGTICAIDRKKAAYSAKEIALLEAMAFLISYVVDMEHISITDSLTGLYNRKYLETLYYNSKYDFTEQHLTLLFIDIDDFKKVNDTYGHDIGDKVLLEFATRLKRHLRKTDVIIRMGGDEFVVIIEYIQHEDELKVVAEKVLASMNEPIVIDEHSIHVSISIGISTSESNSLTLDHLIKKADKAMYEVKSHGKASYKISGA